MANIYLFLNQVRIQQQLQNAEKLTGKNSTPVGFEERFKKFETNLRELIATNHTNPENNVFGVLVKKTSKNVKVTCYNENASQLAGSDLSLSFDQSDPIQAKQVEELFIKLEREQFEKESPVIFSKTIADLKSKLILPASPQNNAKKPTGKNYTPVGFEGRLDKFEKNLRAKLATNHINPEDNVFGVIAENTSKGIKVTCYHEDASKVTGGSLSLSFDQSDPMQATQVEALFIKLEREQSAKEPPVIFSKNITDLRSKLILPLSHEELEKKEAKRFESYKEDLKKFLENNYEKNNEIAIKQSNSAKSNEYIVLFDKQKSRKFLSLTKEQKRELDKIIVEFFYEKKDENGKLPIKLTTRDLQIIHRELQLRDFDWKGFEELVKDKKIVSYRIEKKTLISDHEIKKKIQHANHVEFSLKFYDKNDNEIRISPKFSTISVNCGKNNETANQFESKLNGYIDIQVITPKQVLEKEDEFRRTIAEKKRRFGSYLENQNRVVGISICHVEGTPQHEGFVDFRYGGKRTVITFHTQQEKEQILSMAQELKGKYGDLVNIVSETRERKSNTKNNNTKAQGEITPKQSGFGIGEEMLKGHQAANYALVLLNYAKAYYWSDKDPQMSSMYMQMGNHSAGVMGGFMGAQFLAGGVKLEQRALAGAASLTAKYSGIGAGALTRVTSSKFFQNIPLVGMASTFACYNIALAHASTDEAKATLASQRNWNMFLEGGAIAYMGKAVGVTGIAVSETFNQFYYNANRDNGAMPSLITMVTNEAGNIGIKPVYDFFNNRMVTSSEHVLDGGYAKTSLYTINSFDEKGVARSEIFPVIKLEGNYQEKAQTKVVGNVPLQNESGNFQSDGSSRKLQKWEEFDPEFQAAVNSTYEKIRTGNDDSLETKLSTVLAHWQHNPTSWSGHLYKQQLEDYIKYCETEDVGAERFANYYRDLVKNGNEGEYTRIFSERGITNFKLPDFYVRGDIFPAEPSLDPKLTELGVSFVGDEEGFNNLSYTAKMAVIREAVEQSVLVPYNNADGRFLWDIDGLPAKSADKAAEQERLAKAEELYGLYASHMGSEAHANYTVRLDDFRLGYAGAYVEPVNQMERSFKLLSAEESLNHLQMAIGGITTQLDIINAETLKANPASQNLIDTYPQDREDLNTRIEAFKQKARGLDNYEMNPELQQEFEEIQREQMYLLDCYQPYFKEINKDVGIVTPNGNVVNPADLQKMEQELGYNVSSPSPSSPTPANENGTSKPEETKPEKKDNGTGKEEKEHTPTLKKDKEKESPSGVPKTSYSFTHRSEKQYADREKALPKISYITLPDGTQITVEQRKLDTFNSPVVGYIITSPNVKDPAELVQKLEDYLNSNEFKEKLQNIRNCTPLNADEQIIQQQQIQMYEELKIINHGKLLELNQDRGSIELKETNTENGIALEYSIHGNLDAVTKANNVTNQEQARTRLSDLFAQNGINLQNLLPPRDIGGGITIADDFQYLSAMLRDNNSNNALHSQKGLKEVEAVDEYGNKTTANANEFLEEFTSVLWHFKESGNLEKFIGSSSFEDIKQTLAKGALAEEISEGSTTLEQAQQTLEQIKTKMANIQKEYTVQPETLFSSTDNPKLKRGK